MPCDAPVTMTTFCSVLMLHLCSRPARRRRVSELFWPMVASRQSPQSGRADQGPRAVPEQKLHEQGGGPEGRIFPAAALVAEEPAVLSIHGDDRAENERNEKQRNPAGHDSEEQAAGTAQLDGDRHRHKPTWKT